MGHFTFHWEDEKPVQEDEPIVSSKTAQAAGWTLVVCMLLIFVVVVIAISG